MIRSISKSLLLRAVIECELEVCGSGTRLAINRVTCPPYIRRCDEAYLLELECIDSNSKDIFRRAPVRARENAALEIISDRHLASYKGPLLHGIYI